MIIHNKYFLGLDVICWACGFPVMNSRRKAMCCSSADKAYSNCQKARSRYVMERNIEKAKKHEVVMRVCLGSLCKPGALFPSTGKFHRICNKCSKVLGGNIAKQTTQAIDFDIMMEYE